jgi:hypothetical protein
VLVANRFIRLIFRGVSGGSDSIIFANRSCCIFNLYKSIQQEMSAIFEVASGRGTLYGTNDNTSSHDNAQSKLVHICRNYNMLSPKHPRKG